MKFLEAVLILVGMIVGAGMFAIPFSFWQSGFLLGMIELAILAAIITAVHLAYGDIVLETKEAHRLPGYVRLYLGRRAAAIAKLSALFGIVGTLLVYLLLGSNFLSALLSPVLPATPPFLFALSLAVAGALLTFVPYKKAASINGVLTALLVTFIVILSVVLTPHIKSGYVTGFHVSGVFAAYGVLLFALSGGTVIPDLIFFLGKNRRLAKRAILIGSLAPALLYAFFAFAVVGTAGPAVTREAIAGLAPLGGNATLLGSIIGFLAVFTSYIVLNASFQAFLTLDMKMPRSISWLIGSFLPLVFLAAGITSFIAVISAVGALAVGIDAALVIGSHERLRAREGKGHALRSHLLTYGLIYAIIAGGALYELFIIFTR